MEDTREMTLDEWLKPLHESCLARKQLAELRARIQDWREWALEIMDAPSSLELHRGYEDGVLRNEFGGQVLALATLKLSDAEAALKREQEKVAAWKKSANNWATAFDGFAATIQENNPALAKALRDVGLEMRVDRGS